tara:strand:- start:631 stop:1578 length:948 start_codon:yes stop_codon:yes gene_type:complete
MHGLVIKKPKNKTIPLLGTNYNTLGARYMRITKSKFKQIITEEYNQLLKEQETGTTATYAKLKQKAEEIRLANPGISNNEVFLRLKDHTKTLPSQQLADPEYDEYDEYDEDEFAEPSELDKLEAEMEALMDPSTDTEGDIWDETGGTILDVLPTDIAGKLTSVDDMTPEQLRTHFENVPTDILLNMDHPIAQEEVAAREERVRIKKEQDDIAFAKSVGIDPTPIDPASGLDFKLQFGMQCSGGGRGTLDAKRMSDRGCPQGEHVEARWTLPDHVYKVRVGNKIGLYNERTGRIFAMPKEFGQRRQAKSLGVKRNY